MSARAVAALLLGALLVAALVGAGVVLLRTPDGPGRVTSPPVASLAPDARSPEDLARAACVRVRLVAQGIAANSSAETVRAELAAARLLAAQALRGDGRYAALSGGVSALDEAVRHDEADAAATGLRVALAECAALPPRATS